MTRYYNSLQQQNKKSRIQTGFIQRNETISELIINTNISTEIMHSRSDIDIIIAT